MNIRFNLHLKITTKKKEDSDKEIEEELDHELNCSSEYSIEEMDGPNIPDIGFLQKTPSVHNFILLKLLKRIDLLFIILEGKTLIPIDYSNIYKVI